MNGVRRFLGGGTQPPSPSSTPPLSLSNSSKPSWPPDSADLNSTPALVLRKQQKLQSDDFRNPSTSPPSQSSNSSPMRKSKTGSPVSGLASPWTPSNSSFPRSQTRGSGLLNTRDELLMSLLTSEAVVDSRDFEILSAEEIEELKKEQQVLSSRLGAMSKKLNLETKIRDAAVSLSKVNAAHKRVSKQTDEQLEAANRRVDTAQRELWRVSERANEVHKKLLEHRAGVLGFSVRSLEKKMAAATSDMNGDTTDGSGYNSPNQSLQMSPSPSGMLSASSPRARFDGAHLFAGHADATVPQTPKAPLSNIDVTALEIQLKVATDGLDTATRQQADLARELSLLRLEKEQVETTMGMELQHAEETIISLENELPRLEGLGSQLAELQREKRVWEREREMLEGRLEILEEKSGDVTQMEQLMANAHEKSRVELRRKDEELRGLRAQRIADKTQWEADRAQWQMEKDAFEDAKIEDMARLQEEMDVARSRDRASLQMEMSAARSRDSVAVQKAIAELEGGINTLRSFTAKYGIPVMSGNATLLGIVDAIGMHLDEIASQLQTPGGGQQDLSDASRVAAVLQPVWAMLPSPEARAAKLSRHGSVRSGSQGAISPITPNSSVSSLQITLNVKAPPASLSDMDVRSLKTLYDSRTNPASPNTAVFSIDAFATRVQALIADDRSLIERLLRFAQAHDLLKKNAERAQKLATESNNALETYQKQVRTFEDRNLSMNAKQTLMQEQVLKLQDTVDRLAADKREIEMHATELAQTCRRLTETNDTLTARTFALAEEAAAAPEQIRKELMAQLTECKTALQEAQEELHAMRTSEQSQMESLLDELNSMQTENGNLRAQLRAVKK